MKALLHFETSLTVYQSTWCNIPEDYNVQRHSCENLRTLRKEAHNKISGRINPTNTSPYIVFENRYQPSTFQNVDHYIYIYIYTVYNLVSYFKEVKYFEGRTQTAHV